MAITIDGSGITSANIADGAITTDDILASDVVSLKSGRKNLLINGGFDVWQRGTSFPSEVSTECADRMTRGRSMQAGGDYARIASGHHRFKYATRVSRDVGDTSTAAFYLGQSVETINSLQAANKSVTFSFYLRVGAGFTGSVTANIYSGTGTDQNVVKEAITGVTTVATSVITTGTGSYQLFSITGDVATSATQVFVTLQRTAVGTAVADDYIDTTAWQLELGSVATDFEHRSYGEELALCQRYYETILGFHNSAQLNEYYAVQYKVTKRGSPTVVLLTNNMIGQDTSTGSVDCLRGQNITGVIPAWGDIHVDAEL